jgi:hypothetical protein
MAGRLATRSGIASLHLSLIASRRDDAHILACETTCPPEHSQRAVSHGASGARGSPWSRDGIDGAFGPAARLGDGSPRSVMLVRRAQAPTQLRHGDERMQTQHLINIHDGVRLFLVRGKCARHEVFAERGKPAKFVMPISEAGFREVEKAADPPIVVHNEIVASEITVEERAVRRRDPA